LRLIRGVRFHGKVMWSTLRTLRAVNHRDRADRMRALRELAAAHPSGTASWFLAVMLWEERELAEARGLAVAILEQCPTDYYCLVICLDYHIRAGDPEETLAYAKRLAVADKPEGFRPRELSLAKIMLWPYWLLGYGPAARRFTDAMDAWAHWAREYVKSNSSAASGT
jgi:hypothetical protein